MFKHLIAKIKEYILIFLTATIIFASYTSKSFSEENVFIIDNVEVEGKVNLNFSREKFINRAFRRSFDVLKNRILLSRDLNKVSDLKIKEIKKLVKSFQLVEESYRNDKYKGIFKIFYDGKKVKKLLGSKNISFSQPQNISVIFFPMLFIGDEFINFKNNYFYLNWNDIKVENSNINFILPIDDLDDISRIKEMKNKIENLEVKNFVNKYDIKNYVFAFLDYNKKLKVHIKTSFNNNKVSKNIFYDLKSVDDKLELNLIATDLKKQISDLWKEFNMVNLSLPLSIQIRYKYKSLSNLDNLKSIFNKITIVESSFLEEFNVNDSLFKIYYYGNPKRLKVELSKLGYYLKNDQGYWEIYKDG